MLLGDQATWCVFNDADPTAHTNNSGETLPLGVEIQLYAFAYGREDELGRTIFLHYTIVNNSPDVLDEAYISLWADPDLGDAGDDYVGCDTIRQLGYCYNDGVDSDYGSFPPAVGFDLLYGPFVPDTDGTAFSFRNGEWIGGRSNLPMSSFNKYINGTDPQYNIESYNYMKGLKENGDPQINPVTGRPTTFVLSGDPVAGTGWLDANSADRRYMLSCGPLTMAPGDTQEVVAAVVVGDGDPDFVCVPKNVDTIHAEHIAGTSVGSAFALILDSAQLTGHDYMIVFGGGPDDITWSLIDITSGDTLLANQTNLSGDDDYTVVDGFMVKVIGPPAGVGDWDVPNGTRRFTWGGGAGDFEFEGFQGAIGWDCPAHLFVGDPQCVPLLDLKSVLLRLAATDADGDFAPGDPNASFGYRYGRLFANPPARPEFAPFIVNPIDGYSFQDFTRSVPLSAWDVTSDPPQRLVVGYLENNRSEGTVDGRYWPPWYGDASNTSGNGPREWLWIIDHDYSEMVEAQFTGDILFDGHIPVMYWLTVARRMDTPWETGDEFLIIPSIDFLTDQDVFVFTAPPPVADSMPFARASAGPFAGIIDLRRVADETRTFFDLRFAGLCECAAAGDWNGDGTINIVDIVMNVDHVFRGGPAAPQLESCPNPGGDVDCNGVVDLLDVVYLIDHALRSGGAPCDPCEYR